MKRFLNGMIFCCCTIALAQSSQPAADPTPEAATRPNSERRSRAAEALKVLGPVSVSDEADLQRVVEVAQRQILGDSRLMPCDLKVKIEAGQTSLEGYCLIAEQKSLVLDDLRRIGATSVADHVAVGAIGGDQPYGIVQNEAASVTARPEAKSEQLTVWPAGAELFILQQQGVALFALGPDGYAGFIRSDKVKRAAAGDVNFGNAEPTNHAAELETAITHAAALLGTKYVWGGIDASGIDCSGLTRCAYESIGVHLPRDADQQALAGKLVAIRWNKAALRRGDLIFFSGRRGTISHVALYLGNDDFIEAADGKVQYSSFNPKSANYRQKRVDSFCFGKRVLE